MHYNLLIKKKGVPAMLNKDLLKAEIYRKKHTQSSIAYEIGMRPSLFSSRMKKGNFRRAEVENIIRILNIENPIDIFFDEEAS
jgi:hypothetical protein